MFLCPANRSVAVVVEWYGMPTGCSMGGGVVGVAVGLGTLRLAWCMSAAHKASRQ